MLKAGLPWAGDMGSPATWTEAAREASWSALFKSLDELAAYYKRKTEKLPDKVEVSLEAAHETKPAIYDESKWDEATFWADVEEKLVTPKEAKETLAASTSIVFPVAFGTALADAGTVAFVQNRF